MSPAELKLLKSGELPAESEEFTPEEEEDQTPKTFGDRLPGLAIKAGATAAILVGLLVLNIVLGLAYAFHQLHLFTWIVLAVYCLVGGALVRLFKEREHGLKAITLQWAGYQVWANEDLPQKWEKLTAAGRKLRGFGRTVPKGKAA
ncbi:MULTISPECIES: hypothetical protein [Streptomyces]|uniref:hypothetical protein n=1 Tax=Streptomyces TaxID=1883 RepID=UPI002271B976|nr:MULTISPECIES: hypothetical protein [unclassified Streptomyces]MCY0923714.1 hypothetical protein [Streptomyces sp. H27-G5]MCY0947732.1 hypothetical protein [Streptomyces sp. H34-AA3]MCZ4088489.1 hypothetical protein [Streptomyces sp. H34-S5]MDJ0466996.1 hypothetical protein [Streptomyces sp. H27-C3]